MSIFVRRFTLDPSSQVLLNIESVNILDLAPPNSTNGAGTGTCLMVGEFENGPFNAPTEVFSSTDLAQTFGTLGYQYGSVPGNNPCARLRFADQALVGEAWNGNGFVQLNGKQFSRLILVRANTSVGNVQFTPQAFITGAASFRYVLSAGQVLGLDVDAGPQTATFTATAATLTSSAQTFPDSFVGGENLVLGIDGQPNFTVTFLSTDTTQAAVIARINQFAGFAMAATVTSTTMSLTGLQLGNQAQVRVVSASASYVLTNLGLTVTTVFGTGNVANITAVTPQEIKTIVEAAISNTKVETDATGALRISNTLGTASSFVYVTSATTATALGFVAGQQGTQMGVAAIIAQGATYPTGTGGTFVMSYDKVAPFTVTITSSAAISAVVTAINTAANATIAYNHGGQLAIIGKAPGGSINIISASASAVITQLGLNFGMVIGSPIPGGSIPAGTVVQDSGASHVFVTMQDVVFGTLGVQIGGVTQPFNGPWNIPIRHALDDGTGVGVSAGSVTVVPTPVDIVSVQVVNSQTINNALTEAAIDAAYVNAYANTLDPNSVAKQANITWSARQSNTCRRTVRANAITASDNGLSGRIGIVRTPMGTTKLAAQALAADPGVGAYRDRRVIFCYPQAKTFVPIIAQRGTAGGAGFTFDGNVDAGADGFLASILSQLPPEENPGQLTPFTASVVGLESSPNAQGFVVGDYIAFKAAGICALRIDDGVAIFQSGVTSVDPLVDSGLVRISRQRMADFIGDSLAVASKSFGKKLATNVRRNALVAEIRSFMEQLLNRSNPVGQRIAGYTIDAISGNTADTLAQGLFRIIVNVRTLSSLDSIVLQTTIGENVSVVNQLPAAPLAA